MNSALRSKVRRLPRAPEASWRRPNRRVEQGDAPHATQASGEFDVLHERDVREAAHLLENIGLDEDRLVAEKWPAAALMRRTSLSHRFIQKCRSSNCR